MFLHRSNRAEVLVARLADVVATPVGGPLESECIVVQGKGMERWLTQELSKRHGVWANPDFPFVRGIVDRAFGKLLSESVAEPWASAELTWATARGLHEMAGRSGFEQIRSYLEGDVEHRKLLQLAERVATMLDGYAVYRPELLTQWEERSGSDWQAQLWQALVREHGITHVGTREAEFMAALAAKSGPIAGFPERISLFGISALPPLYLRVLAALASRVQVHLFLLSPSQEYWVDTRSRREVLRAALSETSNEDLEVGNEVLATLGRLHRDFQYLLERDVDYVDLTEQYQEPDATSLLGLVQSDILRLRDRGEDSEKLSVAPGDRSLTVHSCHGATRELEVLRDQITARLDADPTLEARDIIVMTPDIESYAPFIDAVFSEKLDGGDALPFHIADRTPRAAYPVLDAFARLLELVPSRLTGPALLDLLSIEVVRERFAIEADELPTVASWIAETNIRWGTDAAHRELEGQPFSKLNTWRFGLERLLLGYASPTTNDELFAGTLAFDDIEGGVADLLGRFVDFCESIFALQKLFLSSHSMQSWQPLLERALSSVIRSDDNTASQHQLLRESFAKLSEHAKRYQFDEAISLSALLPIVEKTWLDNGTRSNFLSGGISFCQLMPMRSIPHRVVCIVGMNDGAFPKNATELSFDLVSSNPRLGDRKPRDDDRYLFLEALLSARDALIITYTGQDHQTNAVLPASVLVEQLISIAHQSTAQHSVLMRHPLQAFSPRYFSGEDTQLFRYSRRDCRAAKTLRAESTERTCFIEAPVVETARSAEDRREVDLGEFLAFFTQTSRSFLNRRIGLRLRNDQDELATREPMQLEGLEKWRVGDLLLKTLMEHGDVGKAMKSLRASGALPLGTPGVHHLRGEIPVVEAIVEMAKPFRCDDALDNLEVDVTLGRTHIVGQLASLWPDARQDISYSALSGRRELRAWIEHLFLCHQERDGYPRETIAIGRAGNNAAGMRLRPVENADAALQSLVDVFETGQTTPLPFFPQASSAFAKHWTAALEKDPSAGPDDSLAKARDVYRGSDFSHGISDFDDAYVQQLYGASDPIHPDYRPFESVPERYKNFSELSMLVFAPLFAHRERI
ncbi:MAG: exodeoxyribonuclease V subunit gamma [Myxococcales bacterium]|nr:exodeoxyribonuclease V subunit gamma [Myxococcales bacterium]